MKVKDNVQFAYITEVLIEVFHEEMDQLYGRKGYLKVEEFVVVDVDTDCEV